MLPENPDQPKGYPPVTEAEDRMAGRTDKSGGRHERATDISRGSGNPQADLSDAIAALFDKHRAKVAAAATPETRRFALDLLDSVRRETLQTILSKS